ncbi:hypothetical protein AMTRI_Chr03g43630 [Amborella trichopoda]
MIEEDHYSEPNHHLLQFTDMSSFLWFFILSFLCLQSTEAQQTYLNNSQFSCRTNISRNLGYTCNGISSCKTFLFFRSQPTFNSPISIAYLLNSDAQEIAEFNGLTDTSTILTDSLVIVPLNCSCSGSFYQHNTSYIIKQHDTYLTIANNTYEGLTTCEALIQQNPYYDSRNLSVNLRFLVPLRCACPSRNQSSNGVNYLVTYIVTWGDYVSLISERFGVDQGSVVYANELSGDMVIYPFTPLLIPLEREPTAALTRSPPPPPSSPPSSSPPPGTKPRSKKWVFVGIGIGAGILVLLLCGLLVWFLARRKRTPMDKKTENLDKNDHTSLPVKKVASDTYSKSDFSEGLYSAVHSVTVYKFEDLQKATNDFSSDYRVKGSVYRATIKGDMAAIKRMSGDASSEISILKTINHSNIVRLSGFCVHQGNTYLVYEFAENGSLSDWVHRESKHGRERFSGLAWKQRVQIAHDIANGLHYFHNYASPGYVHKDIKSSNVVLDGEFRAKIANFGLARTVENQRDSGLVLTRHVSGTQGYLAPEYLEHGLITPKLDVYAFGVVMLELLTGQEAVILEKDEERERDVLLSTVVVPLLERENARENLRSLMDPSLGEDYPLDLALTMAQLAKTCHSQDLGSRPDISDVLLSLSRILSSSLDWDSSDVTNSSSGIYAR